MTQDTNTASGAKDRYTKNPITITASQWFKNGDHPGDHAPFVGSTEQDRQRYDDYLQHEGKVVRYYRRPDVPGESLCEQCGKPHHIHGWIDTLEQGRRVCPGDWIITGVKGERYPCKPDIFEETYSPAAPAQQPTPSAAAEVNALPEGWVPLVITHEGQHPEEVAYGPQIMMDRLGKWLGKYFDHVVASKAQAAPTADAPTVPEGRYGFWVTHLEHDSDGFHNGGALSEREKAEGWTEVALTVAPQPSPTPQADSQPAPAVGTIAHVGTGKTTLTGAIASALRAARAPADSVLEDAARLERERICAAIKAEDDHCVENGDYMLDSNDCINIMHAKWVRKQGGA